MKVLLTDGNQRSALAVTRSLGKAGIEVYVGESKNGSLSASSRYCTKGFVYPSPLKDEKEFIEAIRQTIIREKVDLVIPIADVTSSVIADHKKMLGQYATIAVVDYETFWKASDKNELHHIAESLGIPTPTLFYVSQRDNIMESIENIPFPCVVKPSRSRIKINGKWYGNSVQRVKNKEELILIFENNAECLYPSMVQREIEGTGYGVFALCVDGEVKILFGHRRLREKPPWGGVSVLRESVPLDPKMRDYSVMLLKRLRWNGVAMIEFKKEHGSGIAYLMEINGRFWGSLQLAIDAGIDFPLMLVKMYLGKVILPQETYRVGIRSRWFLGDVDHLLARLFKKNPRKDNISSISLFLFDFLKFYQRETFYEVESWKDPGPFFYEMRHYILDSLKSLISRIRKG